MRSTIALSILLLVFSTVICRAEKRIALVVGNSSYQSVSPLANPRNDAALIAETLRKVGFILVGGRAQIDLDKPAFDRAIQTFGNELTGADVALFYYAGHGVQVRNVNYLVPISANPVKEADVDFQMVDVNLVLRQMEGSGTKLNLVILDACRNNPFGGRGLRSTESGLAQLRAPEGTLLSYATQPGNVALDGTGSNSPYTLGAGAGDPEAGARHLPDFQSGRPAGETRDRRFAAALGFLLADRWLVLFRKHDAERAGRSAAAECRGAVCAAAAGCDRSRAGAARDRLCHRGHEAVAGQRRRFHELRPPVARRAN